MWEKIEARLAEESKEVLNIHCQKSAKSCRDKIKQSQQKIPEHKRQEQNDRGGQQKHQIVSRV